MNECLDVDVAAGLPGAHALAPRGLARAYEVGGPALPRPGVRKAQPTLNVVPRAGDASPVSRSLGDDPWIISGTKGRSHHGENARPRRKARAGVCFLCLVNIFDYRSANFSGSAASRPTHSAEKRLAPARRRSPSTTYAPTSRGVLTVLPPPPAGVSAASGSRGSSTRLPHGCQSTRRRGTLQGTSSSWSSSRMTYWSASLCRGWRCRSGGWCG